jgi:hypothetical protein
VTPSAPSAPLTPTPSRAPAPAPAPAPPPTPHAAHPAPPLPLPSARSRLLAFHVVYSLLAANFLFPAATYLLAPERALASLGEIVALLGLPPFPIERETGEIWRTLAGTNVLTLGFLCVLLQVDLRRFYAALPALAFLKGASALAFLGRYLLGSGHALFLVIFLWDGLAVALFLVFGVRARTALDALDAAAAPAAPAQERLA